MNPEEKSETVADAGSPASPEPVISSDRREALRRIGKYTAYVAPAMLALVHSRNAAAS